MEKLLLVDGNSITYRAFYALPFLTNREGKPSGAVFGFANILLKMLQNEKPSHLVVAFDHSRKTFRNEIYAEYKMQRKATPPELRDQFPLIKEMCEYWNITDDTYHSRIRAGYTIEEDLTKERKIRRTTQGVECRDHQGNMFSSVREMCKYWNVL